MSPGLWLRISGYPDFLLDTLCISVNSLSFFNNRPEMLCPLLPLLPLSLRLVWLTLRRFLRRLFFLSSDMELLEQRMVSPVSLCGSGQWPV